MIPHRAPTKLDKTVTDFLGDVLVSYDPSYVTMYNGNPVYLTPAVELAKGTAFSCGVTIGEVRKNYVQPHHQFFMAMGPQFRRKIELSPEDPRLEQYLHGAEIEADGENGWAVVMTQGCALGGAKIVNGRAKNHYPKGLRKV